MTSSEAARFNGSISADGGKLQHPKVRRCDAQQAGKGVAELAAQAAEPLALLHALSKAFNAERHRARRVVRAVHHQRVAA
jgi:hypothetical protein